MVSGSLVTVKDKSSEPEQGNIRTVVWPSASARQAVESEDTQMSPGDLAATLREISRVSMDEVDLLIRELQTQSTQLTKIVVDGVKQLPTRA